MSLDMSHVWLTTETHRRWRHLDVAVFENGLRKSAWARRHLHVTGIKYFSEAVISNNVNLIGYANYNSCIGRKN